MKRGVTVEHRVANNSLHLIIQEKLLTLCKLNYRNMKAVSYQRYCPKVPNRKNCFFKMLCTLEPQISVVLTVQTARKSRISIT